MTTRLARPGRANGRYAAFASAASNLVPGDTNQAIDVFVRDLSTGVTRCVSVTRQGMPASRNSYEPVISANGRYVAFESQAKNLVPGDTHHNCDVFVRDLSADVTRWVSVGAAGAVTNGQSYFPAISADGRYVTFQSDASNLVAGDTNRAGDVFVRDRSAHVTRRVSVGPGGRQANDFSYGRAAISADGRYVAFSSGATNLVAGDTNHSRDVFVRDRFG
jgi:Tol biopolymer transport system component